MILKGTILELQLVCFTYHGIEVCEQREIDHREGDVTESCGTHATVQAENALLAEQTDGERSC